MLSFSNEIPAVCMISVKIWLTIIWKMFSRDSGKPESSNLFWEFQSQMLLNISFSKCNRKISQFHHIVNEYETSNLAHFVAMPGWFVLCNTGLKVVF